MSQEDLEVVRRLYRAMEARDYEAAAELTDPSVEWVPDRQRVGDAPVQGRERVIRFFEDRFDVFETVSLEPERIWEMDDQLLVFLRAKGTGRGSGAPFDIRLAHLWTLRDGLVVRGEGYGDRAEALEAAGLSE